MEVDLSPIGSFAFNFEQTDMDHEQEPKQEIISPRFSLGPITPHSEKENIVSPQISDSSTQTATITKTREKETKYDEVTTKLE